MSSNKSIKFSFQPIKWLMMGMALFALVSLVPESATAQSASCTRLKHQLASLGRGSSGGSAKYRRAAKAQQRQISSVQSKLSSFGCRAKKRFFSKSKHPACRNLRSTLSKMKRNLRSLQRKSGGSGRNTSKTRRSILRSMKRNRCGKKDTRVASVRRTSILEQIFGNTKNKHRRQKAARERTALRLENKRLRKKQRRRNSKSDFARLRTTEDQLRNYKYNTVRTMCVRTCDGYFFPVSFSTNKKSIASDSGACNNLCPGTEMKLYYHKTASQTAEQMISTEDGEPYTSLPTAFAYQKSYNPSCSCNYRLLDRKQEITQTKFNAKVHEKESRESVRRTIARIAKPQWRIERGQDPETLQNIKGGLTQAAIAELDPKNIDSDRVAQNRKVRVVGDAYFPTQ
ncbi:MAG: DUF2865 domain-containing protein [Rhizobiaceae bacterium]